MNKKNIFLKTRAPKAPKAPNSILYSVFIYTLVYITHADKQPLNIPRGCLSLAPEAPKAPKNQVLFYVKHILCY